jgi:multiple sugar transport system permease protein
LYFSFERQSPNAMQNAHTVTSGQHIEISAPLISLARQRAGRGLIIAATLGLAAIILVQSLYAAGTITTGFANWRPVLYAYVLWAVALGASQVMVRGEAGHPCFSCLPCCSPSSW